MKNPRLPEPRQTGRVGKLGYLKQTDGTRYSAVEDGVPMLEIILAGIEERGCVIMDVDGGDLVADSVELAAALAGIVLAGDFLHHIHAIRHLAEDRMAIV